VHGEERWVSHWWRDAVFYEIYVRSFADGNGDGVGDMPGVTSRLDYVSNLGVDGIWPDAVLPVPDGRRRLRHLRLSGC
jgi:alpha-glucosidase